MIANTNIEQLKANLKQIELSQLANDETKAQALKDLEELQAEELLKQTFKELQKQKEIRDQEQRAKDAMTPEDYAREHARLSHLEEQRLQETLLAVAELELQQLIESQAKALESQELKVKKLSRNIEKLKNGDKE
jgi:hypothetical protein